MELTAAGELVQGTAAVLSATPSKLLTIARVSGLTSGGADAYLTVSRISTVVQSGSFRLAPYEGVQEMPGPPSALKKALVAEGFEIYRSSPNQVTLADRVRDNLLMDSGVAVIQGESMAVRVVLRAQASNFPAEPADSLFGRARGLSGELVGRGYQEVAADSVPVQDPSDRTRTLDTWYEVAYVLPVKTDEELYSELRFALSLTKNAERS